MYTNLIKRALQHSATHRSILQHPATHCNTLQHTATHCNTLQHTAIHCNKQVPDAYQPDQKYIHYVRVGATKGGMGANHQVVAVCCSVLQCVAVCCKVCSGLQRVAVGRRYWALIWSYTNIQKIHGIALQHIATHCNTLQHNTLQHKLQLAHTWHRWTHCNTLNHTQQLLTHSRSIIVKKHTTVTLRMVCFGVIPPEYSNDTLYLTAPHRNSPQLTATHCNSLQLIATHCNSLQLTVTHTATRAHMGQVIWSKDTLPQLLQMVGFDVILHEYFDVQGRFHRNQVSSKIVLVRKWVL